jgi:uncharacterized protein involved in copper resistance
MKPSTLTLIACLFLAAACSDDDPVKQDTGAKDAAKEAASDTAPPADTGPAVDSDAAGNCTLVGRWKHKVVKGWYTWNADMTVKFEFPDFGVTATGPYTFDGENVKWSTDRGDCIDLKAHYKLRFTPGNCDEYELYELVSEECNNRKTLKGAFFNREK